MISKSSGYAIRGATYLVVKKNEGRKIGIHEISQELNAPQHFLAKILQDLARRKIIGSAKGPNGGFYALNSTSETPVLDIVEVIDGLEAFNRCQLGRDECNNENPCPLHFEFRKHCNAIQTILQNTKLGDLVEDIENGSSFLSD